MDDTGIARAGRLKTPAQTTNGEAVLGNTAKSVGKTTLETPSKAKQTRPLEDFRAVRFAHQRTAASILPEQRVRGCLWTLAAGADHVRVISREERARFANLQTCGSVWHCPVCSAKISEVRRQELNQALTWARSMTASGKPVIPVMLTLTARHKYRDPLKQQLEGLKIAKRRLRQSRDWKDLKHRIAGTITATEVTHGKNGWHTHFHELIFIHDSTGDESHAIALLETLRPRWIRSLELSGMTGDKAHAFDLSGAARAGRYIAKFGAADAYELAQCDKPGGHWGAAEELTKAHRKAGKGKHPFDLLEDAKKGGTVGKRARALFREYGLAFKGRRQLTWSPGFKALIDLNDIDDQQAAEVIEDASQDVLLARIDGLDWLYIRRSTVSRADILNAAEKIGPKGVEALVTKARRQAGETTE